MTCERCKGRGWVRVPVHDLNIVDAFGRVAEVAIVYRTDRCPACGGAGEKKQEGTKL